MALPKSSKFVMVCTRSPKGRFRRAGVDFTAEWRVLEVKETADLSNGVIDAEILARLEAESMVAVKPATEAQVEAYLKDQAELAGKDDKQVIAALAAKNADLEARLMRLELAGGKKDESGKPAPKPNDKLQG